MRTCVTCGRELHPERAEKYSYCTAKECQERNAKGLTVLAVGVNKAADLYEVVDERTRGKVASGSYVEKLVTGSETGPDKGKARRTPSGRAEPAKAPARPPAKPPVKPPVKSPVKSPAKPPAKPARKAPRTRWTASQRTLVLLYSEQGMRPDQIAERVGLTPPVVIEIILGARNRPAP
jgi:hypothetical protein